LAASCVRNILTKNYKNLIIGFQVAVKNVGDVFLRHTTRSIVSYLIIIIKLLGISLRLGLVLKVTGKPILPRAGGTTAYRGASSGGPMVEALHGATLKGCAE